MQRSTPTSFTVSYQTEDGEHHVQRFDIYEPLGPPLLPERQAHVFPRPPLGRWSQCAGLGDEWFAGHLQVSEVFNELHVQSPLVFTAGHALELYLKAAVTAHASFKDAMALKHKLPKLWTLCEAYPGFPMKGLLRRELLERSAKIYDENVRSRMPVDLRQHLSENEILYLALRHVQDLKYLGLPGQTIPAGQALAFALPVANKRVIWQLGMLAQWVWGEWCGKPGYNAPALYRLANKLLAG